MARKAKGQTSQNAAVVAAIDDVAKVGRPKAEIDVNVVKMLAAADLTVRQVAMALGVGLATLNRHIETNPELRAAIDEGREYGNNLLLRKAWQVALAGDAGMLRFLIKNRVPLYKDELDVKHSGQVDHIHRTEMTIEQARERLAHLQPKVIALLAQQNEPKTIDATEVNNGNAATSQEQSTQQSRSDRTRTRTARRSRKSTARESSSARSDDQRSVSSRRKG